MAKGEPNWGMLNPSAAADFRMVDTPWVTIVHNDPVNLMSYVVFVFMRVLGFTKEKATKHMLEVHNLGKSVVATETREKAELYHQQIQAHGLQVTLENTG